MQNLQGIRLEDIIDSDLMKRLLKSFVLATGLGATFLDVEGEFRIVPSEYFSACKFCKLIRSTDDGINRCKESMKKAGELASQLGEPYIFRCHAGLIELSAPIMFKDVYLGSICCGPVLMWEWDELAVQEILNRTEDLSISSESMIVASKEIKVLSGPNVQAAADLLFITANHIAKTGMITLQQRKELNEQQSKLAEAVFAKKKAEETLRILEAKSKIASYPMDKERELIGKVRIGDRQGAKEILNDLLGTIFFSTAGNIEVIKARILELVVVISRAAVEGGAGLEKLFGLNYNFIEQLSHINEFDSLCHWLVKVLDLFFDTVYETRNIKNAKSLSDALTYIRENHSKNLSLDNVSQHVYISPFYLSHLFKEELDITFVEYLTRVRIERAKKLLLDPARSIVSVASDVGYEDASYFSKVFKKTMGISPNQYRKAQ